MELIQPNSPLVKEVFEILYLAAVVLNPNLIIEFWISFIIFSFSSRLVNVTSISDKLNSSIFFWFFAIVLSSAKICFSSD